MSLALPQVTSDHRSTPVDASLLWTKHSCVVSHVLCTSTEPVSLHDLGRRSRLKTSTTPMGFEPMTFRPAFRSIMNYTKENKTLYIKIDDSSSRETLLLKCGSSHDSDDNSLGKSLNFFLWST